MRVALIYVGQVEQNDNPVHAPPLGTPVLTTVLRRAGFDAEVFDTRLQPAAQLYAELDAYNPDVVGLGFLSPSADQATEIARKYRGRGWFVVAGGVHATVHAAELMGTGAFDTVVRREGERALVQICTALANCRTPPKIVDGEPTADLNALPVPDDFECYRATYARNRSVYVQLGRGCPFACTFCEVANKDAFGGGYRHRSIDGVMAHVRTAVARWAVDFVVVLDSIATVRRELALAFVRRMAEEFPDVGYMFNAHVRFFDEELAAEVGRAGNASVWFGFEGGSQRLLDLMNKRTTVQQGIEVSRLCKTHGVRFGANLLLGVPTETAEDYERHYNFMHQVQADFPNPNILTPLPGTKMYDYCRARDLLYDPSDYSIWSAQRIRREGRGPLRNVDYERVLKCYDHFRPPPPDVQSGQQFSQLTWQAVGE